MKVFLGGTCNGSMWREFVKARLECEYFDPVVDDWNEEAQKRERYEREHCDYVLYAITPRMKGVYSIAEVVDDSNKRPEKTILCIVDKDVDDDLHTIISFDKAQMKSLEQVGEMVIRNGGGVFNNLDFTVQYLNTLNRSSSD